MDRHENQRFSRDDIGERVGYRVAIAPRGDKKCSSL